MLRSCVRIIYSKKMSTWTPPRYRTRGAVHKFRESTVSVYKGREQRLVRTTTPLGYVTHYAGAKGQERKVRQVSRSGSVTHYEGPKGKERGVRENCSSGWVYHYEVIDGKNFWARRVGPDGTVEHFKRVKGYHITRSHITYTNGSVEYFEGDKLWWERKVRLEVPSEATRSPKVLFPYGYVEHYEGEHHHERLVCREVPSDEGTRWMYYEGSQGEEKMVRVKKPDGNITYYDDNGDTDYTEWPNGKIAHYWDGLACRLWCVEHPDGRTEFFEDSDTELDDNDPDAPWNVREDCYSNARRRETSFYNGDKFYYCPGNCDRIVNIYRKATGRSLSRAEVLWYRVREWFRKRTIVLHWQEKTQMRLAAPGGEGRLADRVAFVTDFCG